jgi:hypothetical protein
MAAVASRRTVAEEITRVVAPPEDGRGRRGRPTPRVRVRMAMYFSPDKQLHHTRCRQALQLRGVRAELEVDFWCMSCHEHVTLPTYAISQIPVQADPEPSSALHLIQ